MTPSRTSLANIEGLGWAGLLLIALALLLAPVTLAAAQSGGGPSTLLGTDYDLTWNTIDSGGGASLGGGYTLNGTAGQPDAGGPLSGGGYTLIGGFWSGAAAQYRIYLPVLLKN